MTSIVFQLGDHGELFGALASKLNAQQGQLERRRFPDGESYLRFHSDCRGQAVCILCSLDRPDDKTLPLLLAAATLRDLGASRIGLIAPYLAYMRQDKSFASGEGVTAHYFSRLLSSAFDWLITVDPHLHRITALDEIYTIPTRVVHAAPQIAAWIKKNVSDALIIGPDSESEQWVSQVANIADVPYLVLEKVRSGDRKVAVSIPSIGNYSKRTPVLIDDIVSTGETMLATIRHLARLDMRAPVCIAVHGIFAEHAYAALKSSGASAIVTSNTIKHESNGLDLSAELAQASEQLVDTSGQ